MRLSDLNFLRERMQEIITARDEADRMTAEEVVKSNYGKPGDDPYPYWTGYNHAKIQQAGWAADSALRWLNHLARTAGDTDGEYAGDTWELGIPGFVALKCKSCGADHDCEVRIDNYNGDGNATAGVDYDKCEECAKPLCSQCPKLTVDGLFFCPDTCREAAEECAKQCGKPIVEPVSEKAPTRDIPINPIDDSIQGDFMRTKTSPINYPGSFLDEPKPKHWRDETEKNREVRK